MKTAGINRKIETLTININRKPTTMYNSSSVRKKKLTDYMFMLQYPETLVGFISSIGTVHNVCKKTLKKSPYAILACCM